MLKITPAPRRLFTLFLMTALGTPTVVRGDRAPAAAPAGAPAYVVDQHHEPEIFSEWSIRLLGPIGQEFVPTQNRLNVVELWLSHGFVGTEPPTDVFVRVRTGSITGAILGSSAVVTLEDGLFAPVRFDFASPIELLVGGTYVLEPAVVDVAGAGNPLGCGAAGPGGYAAGRAILGGNPSTTSDLWFRTGVTEDVAIAPMTWSAVKRLYR